jgi:hypothetical protein
LRGTARPPGAGAPASDGGRPCHDGALREGADEDGGVDGTVRRWIAGGYGDLPGADVLSRRLGARSNDPPGGVEGTARRASGGRVDGTARRVPAGGDDERSGVTGTARRLEPCSFVPAGPRRTLSSV